MARTLVLDGRGVSLGDWAGRLYDRLVDELGEEEAHELAGRAHRLFMPKVRTQYSDAPGLHKHDVILEALLLALNVPEHEIPSMARRDRSGQPVELGPYLTRSI